MFETMDQVWTGALVVAGAGFALSLVMMLLASVRGEPRRAGAVVMGLSAALYLVAGVAGAATRIAGEGPPQPIAKRGAPVAKAEQDKAPAAAEPEPDEPGAVEVPVGDTPPPLPIEPRSTEEAKKLGSLLGKIDIAINKKKWRDASKLHEQAAKIDASFPGLADRKAQIDAAQAPKQATPAPEPEPKAKKKRKKRRKRKKAAGEPDVPGPAADEVSVEPDPDKPAEPKPKAEPKPEPKKDDSEKPKSKLPTPKDDEG